MEEDDSHSDALGDRRELDNHGRLCGQDDDDYHDSDADVGDDEASVAQLLPGKLICADSV